MMKKWFNEKITFQILFLLSNLVIVSMKWNTKIYCKQVTLKCPWKCFWQWCAWLKFMKYVSENNWMSLKKNHDCPWKFDLKIGSCVTGPSTWFCVHQVSKTGHLAEASTIRNWVDKPCYMYYFAHYSLSGSMIPLTHSMPLNHSGHLERFRLEKIMIYQWVNARKM